MHGQCQMRNCLLNTTIQDIVSSANDGCWVWQSGQNGRSCDVSARRKNNKQLCFSVLAESCFKSVNLKL